MASPKRPTKKEQSDQSTAPQASRPHIIGYGIPKSKKGLLPWSHVEERMAQARVYWVSTVSPDNHPHATPVDGIWLDGRLYFGGSPTTRRNRNLMQNPAVCIHLESGSDVLILHGDAIELQDPPQELAAHLAKASAEKYGYGQKPEDYAAGGVFAFQPKVVFAWNQGLSDATRWILRDGE